VLDTVRLVDNPVGGVTFWDTHTTTHAGGGGNLTGSIAVDTLAVSKAANS
jgi:hypothetical protein